MRYLPVHDPADNEVFPWQVADTLDTEIVGPCWSALDAAIVAWALSHKYELLSAHDELRTLVDRCVDRRIDQGGPIAH